MVVGAKARGLLAEFLAKKAIRTNPSSLGSCCHCSLALYCTGVAFQSISASKNNGVFILRKADITFPTICRPINFVQNSTDPLTKCAGEPEYFFQSFFDAAGIEPI